jgi:hypothetical protein
LVRFDSREKEFDRQTKPNEASLQCYALQATPLRSFHAFFKKILSFCWATPIKTEKGKKRKTAFEKRAGKAAPSTLSATQRYTKTATQAYACKVVSNSLSQNAKGKRKKKKKGKKKVGRKKRCH